MTLERETNIPLAIVVAVSRNNAIGKGNELPWRISEDLKFFKSVTLGKPCIMGRKTYESIGKALPNRDNIVITRNAQFTAPNVTVANDLEDAIKIAEAFAIARSVAEICIIGGGEIYRQSIEDVTKLYLTKVDTIIEDADAFFPEINEADWTTKEIMSVAQGPTADFACVMVEMVRK